MTDGNDGGPVTRRSDPNGHRAYKFRVGEIVSGKYRIESMLGTGGMGTVFRAHHVHLDRPVALKVMHAAPAALGDAARRFGLEARATAALKSAHVVRILDIDHLPTGAPFIVMELLEGKDLASLVVERGPLAVDRAVHYVLQVADAIAEAHSRGIVHRDLKPQNMILTTEGLVKVLDFGLAKALHPLSGTMPDSERTAMSMIVGTPHYMSPEQVLAGRVDERTDIWGLGATLYALLAGEPPFPVIDLEAYSPRIGVDAPPRLADRRDDVTPSVDGLIVKCLRRNPDERFQTVAALQAALIHLRVELAARGPRVLPGETARMGETALPTTRRKDAVAASELAATLAPPTVQDAGITERPPTTRPSNDDEPTEISTSLHELAADRGTPRKP